MMIEIPHEEIWVPDVQDDAFEWHKVDTKYPFLWGIAVRPFEVDGIVYTPPGGRGNGFFSLKQDHNLFEPDFVNGCEQCAQAWGQINQIGR